MDRRRTALLAVVPLLGALLTAVPSAQAQEASPAPAPAAVEVGEEDSGRTVRLLPGQELSVVLDAPQGEQWQGPGSAGPLYLVAYEEREARTTARLQALRTSSEPVRLSARTDRACQHSGEPCPQAFSTWTLDVVVDPGEPASGSYPCLTMPSPSPAPGTVHLTERSSGARVTVQQGKQVLVQLGGCHDPYAVPASGGPLFRESATYRANGVNSTSFRALGTGSTTITAQSDPACFHTATPCARPTVLWSVHVEVVPATADDTCLVPARAELERPTIVATGEAGVRVVSGAGAVVDLFAYTRPSTEFRLVRTATVPSDGVARFVLRPPANTRLYAQRRGCSPGPQVVQGVATALTLHVERVGPRTYLFSGDSLPARPGGLVVSLYRTTPDGREVLTAQARADAVDGTWSVLRRFTGTGRFGFLARTGQDLQNAPGRTAVRSLLVS